MIMSTHTQLDTCQEHTSGIGCGIPLPPGLVEAWTDWNTVIGIGAWHIHTCSGIAWTAERLCHHDGVLDLVSVDSKVGERMVEEFLLDVKVSCHALRLTTLRST
jgi:hypothetical protein